MSSFGARVTESLKIVPYSGEEQLPDIQELIDQDLSEPYSVFTYRYFLNQWPHLCYLAMIPADVASGGDDADRGDCDGVKPRAMTCVGTVVCKLVGFRAARPRAHVSAHVS